MSPSFFRNELCETTHRFRLELVMRMRLSVPALRCSLGAVFIASTVADASAAAYVWNFDSFDLSIAPGSDVGEMHYRGDTAPLTFFETTGGMYPNINGQTARYLRHNAWPTPAANDTTLGYDLTFAASGPNGGGSFINQYTFVLDVLVPPDLGYVPIFQTDTDMTNDADWYIAPDGSFGIGDLGYSSPLLTTDTWYRLGFVADLGANDVRYYLNGSLVHTTTATGLLDGRFSLYSNVDAGPDLVLFNENDASGNYTHAALYNSIAFFDRPLSSAEMSALGGPSAAGIPVPEPSAALVLFAGVITLLLRRESQFR
jgi:hypothetical protein